MHLGLAMALVLSTACGKDEPAKPQPPATTAAPATTAPPSEPTKPEAAADTKQVEPTKPAAVTPLPPATSSALPEQAPLVSTTLATIPADVVAVGGVANPRALMDAFLAQAKLVPGLTQTADPLEFALTALRGALGVKDMAWLALDKPVRFAVPNPKKYAEGFIQIYTLTPGTKLDVTTFTTATPKDEGHWASIPAGDKKVYLDLAESSPELLVITSHPTLLKDQAALITELGAWVPSAPLVIEASAANARAVFAAELTELQTNLDGLGKQLAEAGMEPDQLAMMKGLVDGAFGVLTGLDRLGLAVDATGAFPRLAFSFRAAPGSELATTITDLQKRRPTLASLVPAEAWLSMVYDMELGDLFGDSSMLASVLVNAKEGAKWTPEEAQDFAAKIKRMQELTTGNSAFWIGSTGAFPFAMESVSSVTDGPAMREALLGVFDTFFKKQWGAARQGLIDGGASADMMPGLEFKDFITKASTFTRAFGIVPSLPSVVGADTLAIDIDWNRLGGGRIPASLRDAINTLVGSHLEIAFAPAPTRFVAAIGPYAASRAVELAIASADAQVKDPWIARAVTDSFAVFNLRPARLLRALLELPQLAPQREMIGKLSDDPLQVAAASDGTSVNVTLSLPAALLVALVLNF